MKPTRIASLAALILWPWLCSAQQIQTEMVSGHEVAAHEVLLKLSPGVSALGLSRATSHAVDAETMQPVGTGRIRLKSRSLDVPTLIAQLSLNPMVASVEPNYIIHASSTIPNDPDFPNLWAMQNTGQTIQGQTGTPFADIGAAQAWDIGRGSASVVVGVIDSGVDYTHPDLAANVWTAQAAYQISANGVTYNCPAGGHGFNFVALTCDPLDDFIHGTHVSGTIGAQGNNLLGVTGVNWTTAMVALKFLDSTGAGTVADAVNAIEAAIQLQSQGINIRILNNSWGVGANSGSLQEAVDDANNNNMLFVAAAGNGGSSNDGETPEYPASFNTPNVVAVAATDNQDNLASFSNYGPNSVQVGAPGVNIQSTVPGAAYAYMSGTSMAAPHVSGTAALVLSKCTLTTAELKAAILNSADIIPSLEGKTVTGGRVNVYKALNYCGASPSPEFAMSATATALSAAPGTSATTQIGVTDLGSFSGTVSLSATGLPSGVTVSFSKTSLAGSGTSVLTLTTSAATPPGTYPITVLGTSSSLVFPVSLTLTVGAPSLTLAASPGSLNIDPGGSANAAVTISALNGFNGVVNLSASGLPTGVSAAFSPASVTGSGTPTLTLTAAASTALGTYSVTLQGSSGTLTSSMIISLQVVAAPDFTLSASPASVTSTTGGSAHSTLTVSALNGFSGAVSLSASGMPAGVTAAFAPASVTGAVTSALTLTASSATASGTYPITVQGTSGNLIHTTIVSLTVTTPDFTLAVSPTAVTVAPGGSTTSTVAIGAINGFTGAVNLATSGLPAGVSVSFAPTSVSGAGSSVLTLTAAASATIGAFNVVIQGTSGSLAHSASLAVTAQPAIILPVNVSVLPGASIPYAVSLPSPAPANVYVALTSSNPNVVTVTPANVLIQAGATAPSLPPKLNGVSLGSATIGASAWNYVSASQPVAVTDALSFQPASVTVGQGASQFLSLTLSAPLSANLTVNLSSANPAVATVPATVTIPANTVSASVRVTGVAGGSAVIHASALPSIPDTTATVTVGAALTIVTTSLANGSVNGAYSQALAANGGIQPLTWALIAGVLPAGLTLNPATGQITGTPVATINNTPLTFKVSDASFPPQTATASFTLTISSGGASPASIAVLKGSPQSTPVNSAFSMPLVAVVKDASGNPVSGVAVAFAAPSTGATGTFSTGSSTTVTTDATGAATATFSANGTAGSYAVIASISGATTPAVFLLTNLAGPAARIAVISGSGQYVAVNTLLAAPLVVLVSDANGNPVNGAKVTFAAPATGASGSFAGGANTSTTNASGIAVSAPFTANGTAGSYTVTASAAGVAASVGFSLNNVGTPASVTAVSGGGQSAPINSAFTNPLVVKVADAAGNLLAGVAVVFAAPSSGASGAFSASSTVISNNAGLATAPKFTANSTAGTYNVTASVAGVGSTALFSLTNLSGIILPPVATVTLGTAPFPVTLGVPAGANGVFIALTSSDPTKVTIAPSNIFVPAGATIPTVTPKITGINLGSVTITASAWNYQTVSQPLQVSLGITFFPSSVTSGSSSVQFVTLILSAPAPTQLTVNLSSDTPSVVTVPATVTFPANATSMTVRLTEVGPGSANITAGAPPNVTPSTLPVTVQ